ncbi:hypothetical protein BJX62DRAFT_196664 [Aspergillus germanicus]
MAGQVTPTGNFIDSILRPPSSNRKSAQHICSILHAFQYHYNGVSHVLGLIIVLDLRSTQTCCEK